MWKSGRYLCIPKLTSHSTGQLPPLSSDCPTWLCKCWALKNDFIFMLVYVSKWTLCKYIALSFIAVFLVNPPISSSLLSSTIREHSMGWDGDGWRRQWLGWKICYENRYYLQSSTVCLRIVITVINMGAEDSIVLWPRLIPAEGTLHLHVILGVLFILESLFKCRHIIISAFFFLFACNYQEGLFFFVSVCAVAL